MRIRQARIGDYRGIYQLVKRAFQTAHVTDGAEQDLVLELRGGQGYQPALELVAEQADGTLVGHVMFTEMEVPDSSRTVRALLLAPLCVRQDERAQGVGSALVREGFQAARALGYQAAFLCGDPAYYSRFGFRPVEEMGLENISGIPAPYVQGIALTDGALDGVTGKVRLM